MEATKESSQAGHRIEGGESVANNGLKDTRNNASVEKPPDKAPNTISPIRLAMKVKSWGKDSKTASRVPFPMSESAEEAFEPASEVQRSSTDKSMDRRLSTYSRKRTDTRAVLRVLESIELQLSKTEIDQKYKEYLIERRRLLLGAATRRTQHQIQPVQAENLWQRLETIFNTFHSIENDLTAGQEDVGYRQHLFERGLLLDAIPPQYLQHLESIRKSILMSDPPSDPWIKECSDRRLTNSNYSKRYLMERWGGVTSGKVDKLMRDRADLVSFGKRASIIEFSNRRGVIFQGIPPIPPSRIRPKVSEVIQSDSLYIKQRAGLRWIHLPANNMSWVENLMESLSRNISGDDESGDPVLSDCVLNYKYWSGGQNSYSAFSKAPFDHQRTPHHARFMRPICMGLPTHLGADDDDERTDMAFFMPYLHWETDVARLHTHYIINDVDTQLSNPNISNLTDEEIARLPCDIEEKLLRKYLHHPSPLHIRRTLDQAYY
ncbi:hypothetical protein HYALB_00001957 [Hymenoscyphus albidus]|uniref:Uncharacterized protein n=1 Tax=Hymenoscyphus albidus TaxID=595503 RepID=A0A9N9LFW0_9HELO|nr:hypothetical protein HYALB_00001957 [Hymenoscyphus albidus]